MINQKCTTCLQSTKLAHIRLFLPAVLLASAVSLSACSSSEPTYATSVEQIKRVNVQQDFAQCSEQAIIAMEKRRILASANGLLDSPVRTITSDRAIRSQGSKNDFYSEGDYWWPVPGEPNAPYQRKDGQTNPDNFIAHRLSMLRLADHIGVLSSAFVLTGEDKYAQSAKRHLHAWFIDSDTKMLPRLLFAQAIQGRHTGRSIGLIDTLHLVEVARSAKILINANAIPEQDAVAIKNWFSTYANWMNTHPYGIKERDWHNNHSIAWSLQVAAFADLVDDEPLLELVRERFKNVYLQDMMDAKGGFPNELARTKPFGYSLFVLDLMAGIASIASTPSDNLWKYKTKSGRSMRLAVSFLVPFIVNKENWPYAKDIQYWDDWPVRQPFLLQAGIALKECELLKVASKLPAQSDIYEVRRNWPMRHPIIWLNGW